jgi:FkbM family methyltransferase
MNIRLDLSTENIEPEPNWRRIINGDGPVILDVGANDGGTTAVFSNQFPFSRIYAFEPDPRAIQRFRSRIELGQLDPSRCQLFECAVSSSKGKMTFYQSSGENPDLRWYETGWDLSGSLKKPVSLTMPGNESIVFMNSIQVSVTTLDFWNEERQLPTIDLLWIDTQGAELDVLKGAQKMLEKTKLIYLECSEENVYEDQAKYEDLVSYLNNFFLLKKYPNDLLFVSKSILP